MVYPQFSLPHLSPSAHTHAHTHSVPWHSGLLGTSQIGKALSFHYAVSHTYFYFNFKYSFPDPTFHLPLPPAFESLLIVLGPAYISLL